MDTRNVVFITHANPEGNPFAIWLGAKLASAGYEVWADVLKLRGGQDWQRPLEESIRLRARKVLFAANQVAAGKQGVRNEIQIASDTAKKIHDTDFIIPLRLVRSISRACTTYERRSPCIAFPAGSVRAAT